MTFIEKYQSVDTWHEKALIMSLFHLTASCSEEGWTVTKTAHSFECSIGLVSENLKLAREIDKNPKLIQCKSRMEALERIK